MSLHALEQRYGLMVIASVIGNHNEAVAACKSGRLPTVDPPAESVVWAEGSAA